MFQVYEAKVVFKKLRSKPFESLSSPEDVAKGMKPLVKKAGPQEHLWILALDGGNNVLAIREFVGFYNQVPLDIKLILQFLLLTPCTSFVVCHSHPGGNASPTP